jgi:transposase
MGHFDALLLDHAASLGATVRQRATVVARRLSLDPQDGHLYVFTNARKTSMKVLSSIGTGWCVLAERLEQGTFQGPEVPPGATQLRIDPAVLGLILEGVDLSRAPRRKRHAAPEVVTSVSVASPPTSGCWSNSTCWNCRSPRTCRPRPPSTITLSSPCSSTPPSARRVEPAARSRTIAMDGRCRCVRLGDAARVDRVRFA